MSAVIFFIAAIGALTGAIGVVALRNPFYSVLSLVGHLLALSRSSCCCGPSSSPPRR